MTTNRLGSIFKKIKKEQLLLCLLFGILLLVIALPTSGNEGTTQTVSQEEHISTNADLLERQLEQVLSYIEGVGVTEVAVTLEPLVDGNSAPQIRGVIVVAKTGDNPVVVQKIQEAVMTLFQLEAHKIKVMKMK